MDCNNDCLNCIYEVCLLDKKRKPMYKDRKEYQRNYYLQNRDRLREKAKARHAAKKGVKSEFISDR